MLRFMFPTWWALTIYDSYFTTHKIAQEMEIFYLSKTPYISGQYTKIYILESPVYLCMYMWEKWKAMLISNKIQSDVWDQTLDACVSKMTNLHLCEYYSRGKEGKRKGEANVPGC